MKELKQYIVTYAKNKINRLKRQFKFKKTHKLAKMDVYIGTNKILLRTIKPLGIRVSPKMPIKGKDRFNPIHLYEYNELFYCSESLENIEKKINIKNKDNILEQIRGFIDQEIQELIEDPKGYEESVDNEYFKFIDNFHIYPFSRGWVYVHPDLLNNQKHAYIEITRYDIHQIKKFIENLYNIAKKRKITRFGGELNFLYLESVLRQIYWEISKKYSEELRKFCDTWDIPTDRPLDQYPKFGFLIRYLQVLRNEKDEILIYEKNGRSYIIILGTQYNDIWEIPDPVYWEVFLYDVTGYNKDGIEKLVSYLEKYACLVLCRLEDIDEDLENTIAKDIRNTIRDVNFTKGCWKKYGYVLVTMINTEDEHFVKKRPEGYRISPNTTPKDELYDIYLLSIMILEDKTSFESLIKLFKPIEKLNMKSDDIIDSIVKIAQNIRGNCKKYKNNLSKNMKCCEKCEYFKIICIHIDELEDDRKKDACQFGRCESLVCRHIIAIILSFLWIYIMLGKIKVKNLKLVYVPSEYIKMDLPETRKADNNVSDHVLIVLDNCIIDPMKIYSNDNIDKYEYLKRCCNDPSLYLTV